MTHFTQPDREKTQETVAPGLEMSPAALSELGDSIRCPGLTVAASEVAQLAGDVVNRLSVFLYKEAGPCLWVIFVGGTGTGKSTLFNTLCGESLSRTGVERPKTSGPIAYAHKRCSIEPGFPLEEIPVEVAGYADANAAPSAGRPGHLVAFIHVREDWSHLVLLDTPDMDSVEPRNLASVETFYRFADAVVFVTSQDKYADDVPYRFLVRIAKDRTPCFLLVNKAQGLTKEEILAPLRRQGAAFPENRLWLVAYHPSGKTGAIAADDGFKGFSQTLSGELSPERADMIRAERQEERAEALVSDVEHLSGIIETEYRETQRWLDRLERLCDTSCADLIRGEKERFTTESRQHLQMEIRKLFQRYDPLSKPRRFVRQILSAPLALLGVRLGRRPKDRRDALSKVREKIDLTPIWGAVEQFNRAVLEQLSPKRQDSPLFIAIHQSDMPLTEAEIRAALAEEHDRLDQWLEAKFKELARGLPRHKRWGIYSTSVLWGTLIVSFEIVVGGGFSGLDAILDSMLAPFITKGSMELFAYREIKVVARELAKQYQQALRSIVERQRDRYRQAVLALLMEPGDLDRLKGLSDRIAAVRQGRDHD
jgi:hypothetical protein